MINQLCKTRMEGSGRAKESSRLAFSNQAFPPLIMLAMLACALVFAGIVASSSWYGAERAYAAGAGSLAKCGNAAVITAQSSSSKAHAAYKQKLRELCKEYGQTTIRYKFADLNRDGVDEMVVAWFPGVYAYSNGKVKCVDAAATGTSSYLIAPKAKVLVRVQPDHVGSAVYRYFKWSGKKLVNVATVYTPDKNQTYLSTNPTYWIKGKGNVSKKSVTSYVKKLCKGSKLRQVSYKQLRV